jgi:hypothetical protein
LAGHTYKAIRALVHLQTILRMERLELRDFGRPNPRLPIGGLGMTLYFLRCLNGIASDFAPRLDAIPRRNFHPVEVLRAYGHRDENWIRQLERETHSELEGVNAYHEFFADSPEVRAVIERLDGLFY